MAQLQQWFVAQLVVPAAEAGAPEQLVQRVLRHFALGGGADDAQFEPGRSQAVLVAHVVGQAQQQQAGVGPVVDDDVGAGAVGGRVDGMVQAQGQVALRAFPPAQPGRGAVEEGHDAGQAGGVFARDGGRNPGGGEAGGIALVLAGLSVDVVVRAQQQAAVAAVGGGQRGKGEEERGGKQSRKHGGSQAGSVSRTVASTCSP